MVILLSSCADSKWGWRPGRYRPEALVNRDFRGVWFFYITEYSWSSTGSPPGLREHIRSPAGSHLGVSTDHWKRGPCYCVRISWFKLKLRHLMQPRRGMEKTTSWAPISCAGTLVVKANFLWKSKELSGSIPAHQDWRSFWHSHIFTTLTWSYVCKSTTIDSAEPLPDFIYPFFPFVFVLFLPPTGPTTWGWTEAEVSWELCATTAISLIET